MLHRCARACGKEIGKGERGASSAEIQRASSLPACLPACLPAWLWLHKRADQLSKSGAKAGRATRIQGRSFTLQVIKNGKMHRSKHERGRREGSIVIYTWDLSESDQYDEEIGDFINCEESTSLLLYPIRRQLHLEIIIHKRMRNDEIRRQIWKWNGG